MCLQAKQTIGVEIALELRLEGAGSADHTRPFGREEFGNLLADAATGSRDNGHLVLKLPHTSSLQSGV